MKQTTVEPVDQVYCLECGADVFECVKCSSQFEEGEIIFCDIKGVADRKANREAHFCADCSGKKIMKEEY